MTAAVEVVALGAAGIRAKTKGLPSTALAWLVAGMNVVAPGLLRYMKEQKLSGQSLNVRSGNLRRAGFFKVGTVGATDAVGAVGIDLAKARYGRVHDLGGRIVPRSGRFLTIPLDAAMTASGVSRFTARQVIADPGAYGYVGTFFAKGVLFGVKTRMKTGRLKSGASTGKKVAVAGYGEVVPLFALKTSVTLKAVGYIKGTIDERRAWARETLRAVIDVKVKEFNSGGS